MLNVLAAILFAAPVRVGVINSVTGAEAPIGESLANGYRLAEEDLKGAVELVVEDDASKPQLALRAFEKLARRSGRFPGWRQPE